MSSPAAASTASLLHPPAFSRPLHAIRVSIADVTFPQQVLPILSLKPVVAALTHFLWEPSAEHLCPDNKPASPEHAMRRTPYFLLTLYARAVTLVSPSFGEEGCAGVHLRGSTFSLMPTRGRSWAGQCMISFRENGFVIVGLRHIRKILPGLFCRVSQCCPGLPRVPASISPPLASGARL
ncbi:hypothetical protein DAEQUDRAFT_172663 [Daedalea quercina L-15889]|uniref:Uncharacterized protein n=1 Tax=Daedalea quercina L-15889 TaxID=1314783 RepID=A0A165KJ53_9APHY|nr:hypothetical protein DAEQUDRAFT_172663 [Daedalea quercina L-15889]